MKIYYNLDCRAASAARNDGCSCYNGLPRILCLLKVCEKCLRIEALKVTRHSEHSEAIQVLEVTNFFLHFWIAAQLALLAMTEVPVIMDCRAACACLRIK